MLKLDEGSGRDGETGRGQEECDEHQRPCVRVVMRGEGEIPLKKKLGMFRACADADRRDPIEKEN